MPNKQRSSASSGISPYNPKGKIADNSVTPAVPDASISTGLSNAAAKVAGEFNSIADAAAKSEGAAAGKLDGLDNDFVPTRSLTLRGEAYDKAAIETYTNRLDANLRTDMQSVVDKNSGSPEQLKTALDTLGDEYRAKHVFDEVLPKFESTFMKLRLPYEHAVQVAANKATEDGAKESYAGNVAAQKSTLTTAATSVGIDPAADKAVAAQLEDYHTTLQQGVANGHIEEPVAIGMQREAATTAATAAVTGMFNRLPDLDAQEAFLDRYNDATDQIAKTYKGLDAGVMDQIHAGLMARLRQSTDAAAKLENSADDIRIANLEDRGSLMLKAGELTPDWIDANADMLGSRAIDYRNAVTNAPPASQPATSSALLQRAIEDPAAATREAVTAMGQGALSRQGFGEIHDMAQRAAVDQQARPWVNDIRRDLAARTAPSDDQDNDQASIHALASPAFESWLDQNPDTSRAAAAAQASEIAGQFISSAAASARATLPLPRFAQTARNEITPKALPEIAQRLSMSHDQGEIDDDELLRQTELLDKWKAAIERHSGKGT